MATPASKHLSSQQLADVNALVSRRSMLMSPVADIVQSVSVRTTSRRTRSKAPQRISSTLNISPSTASITSDDEIIDTESHNLAENAEKPRRKPRKSAQKSTSKKNFLTEEGEEQEAEEKSSSTSFPSSPFSGSLFPPAFITTNAAWKNPISVWPGGSRGAMTASLVLLLLLLTPGFIRMYGGSGVMNSRSAEMMKTKESVGKGGDEPLVVLAPLAPSASSSSSSGIHVDMAAAMEALMRQELASAFAADTYHDNPIYNNASSSSSSSSIQAAAVVAAAVGYNGERINGSVPTTAYIYSPFISGKDEQTSVNDTSLSTSVSTNEHTNKTSISPAWDAPLAETIHNSNSIDADATAEMNLHTSSPTTTATTTTATPMNTPSIAPMEEVVVTETAIPVEAESTLSASAPQAPCQQQYDDAVLVPAAAETGVTSSNIIDIPISSLSPVMTTTTTTARTVLGSGASGDMRVILTLLTTTTTTPTPTTSSSFSSSSSSSISNSASTSMSKLGLFVELGKLRMHPVHSRLCASIVLESFSSSSAAISSIAGSSPTSSAINACLSPTSTQLWAGTAEAHGEESTLPPFQLEGLAPGMRYLVTTTVMDMRGRMVRVSFRVDAPELSESSSSDSYYLDDDFAHMQQKQHQQSVDGVVESLGASKVTTIRAMW